MLQRRTFRNVRELHNWMFKKQMIPDEAIRRIRIHYESKGLRGKRLEDSVKRASNAYARRHSTAYPAEI